MQLMPLAGDQQLYSSLWDVEGASPDANDKLLAFAHRHGLSSFWSICHLHGPHCAECCWHGMPCEMALSETAPFILVHEQQYKLRKRHTAMLKCSRLRGFGVLCLTTDARNEIVSHS